MTTAATEKRVAKDIPTWKAKMRGVDDRRTSGGAVAPRRIKSSFSSRFAPLLLGRRRLVPRPYAETPAGLAVVVVLALLAAFALTLLVN